MAHLLILRGTMGAGKSRVAQELRQRRPALRIIEIDHLKETRYGTAGKCNPREDFAEAGRLVRAELEKGFHAVVIEPLCKRSHLRLVLDAAGRSENSVDVSFVWLACSFETGTSRKKIGTQRLSIRWQYWRYASRHRPAGELVVYTDNLSVGEVAEAVLKMIPN